jgi:hypothetical protein
MRQPEEPLAWWEHGGTRRAVAMSFIFALVLVFIALYPDLDEIYAKHSAVQNFLSAVPVVLGLFLASFELIHSGEANEHRTELNRLNGKANEFRAENIRLQAETLKLQAEVHQLQQDIEKRLTKIRLYVRAHLTKDGLQLLVSNLSEFDLWINQVEVIVTEGAGVKPHNRTILGATRISRGKMEDGYLLYGALVSINDNRTDRFNMKFHVKVVVTGVEDDPITINSPEYHFTSEQGKTTDLEVVKY